MLTLNSIYKSYGKHLVLDNLNLNVKAGEIYGLLGPNGAGKTTTINLICNLLKPDKGTIKINEQLISKKTRNLLGIAPQDNLLYPSLTCEENLDFFGKIYGIRQKIIKKQIAATLASVNLLERAKTPVGLLSGGMQRRMNIAVALIHQPKLLILDEPTTGLDIESRYDIWQLIENLRKAGITILLTTHFLDEAQKLCQQIGIMKQGKIVAEGSLNELRRMIPAQEVVLIKTQAESEIINRGKALGFQHRYYGKDLGFWLPQELEIREILAFFEGIPIDSISRQSVQLEHIYLEVMQ